MLGDHRQNGRSTVRPQPNYSRTGRGMCDVVGGGAGGTFITTKPDRCKCCTSRSAAIPRHRVVGVVDPLPPLISECEGEGLGDFVRSGRAEVGRIGHSGAIWKVARTSRGVPGCLVFSEAPITRTMPCPVTQWVIGAKSRAAAGIRQVARGSGPGRAAAARQAGRALRDGCRDNPRTPHRAWCRFW